MSLTAKLIAQRSVFRYVVTPLMRFSIAVTSARTDGSSHQYHNQCLHPSVTLKGTYVRTQKRSRNPRVLGNWQQLRKHAHCAVSLEPFSFCFLGEMTQPTQTTDFHRPEQVKVSVAC